MLRQSALAHVINQSGEHLTTSEFNVKKKYINLIQNTNFLLQMSATTDQSHCYLLYLTFSMASKVAARSCVAQLLLVYQEIGKNLDAGLETD